MADKAAPSTTAIAVAVGLIALTFGYFLGQGSSLGLFGGSKKSNKVPKSWPNSYDVTIHADSSDDEAGGNEDEDPEEGDGQELKSFADTADEVKLVIAVRTDLGMGKGRFIHSAEPEAAILLGIHKTLTRSLDRQNCSPSFTCHPRVLQVSCQPPPFCRTPQAMGTGRTAEDRGAGQIGGGVGGAASSGNESGTVRKNNSRRWEDADCGGQHDCAGRAGPKADSRSSDRALEAALTRTTAKSHSESMPRSDVGRQRPKTAVAPPRSLLTCGQEHPTCALSRHIANLNSRRIIKFFSLPLSCSGPDLYDRSPSLRLPHSNFLRRDHHLSPLVLPYVPQKIARASPMASMASPQATRTILAFEADKPHILGRGILTSLWAIFLSNVSRVQIIESTLREGEQFANAYFDTAKKIEIAKALEPNID